LNKGVEFFIQTGDLTEGHYNPRRSDHVFEVSDLGFEAQANAVVERFPNLDGKQLYFILGNHDLTFAEVNGAHIGQAIEERRKDFHCLGTEEADLIVGEKQKGIIRIVHPSKTGASYALSYRPQKMIEAMSPGEKPNVLIIGHYHKIEQLFYRGVHTFQAGTMQSQTPFMRNKSLAAHKAGWIIEQESSKDGSITSLNAELIPFYK